MDMMNRRVLKLRDFKVLVLDEFDRMLDMGFVRDVKKISGAMPNREQTMLFSATIDKTQAEMIKTLVHKPLEVKVGSGQSSTNTVAQEIIKVGEQNKFQLLKDLLGEGDVDKAIIFLETKHRVNQLSKKLNKAGFESDVIHGGKSQNYRVKALDKFKKGKIKILIATDVAARGIDIADISHVINYQTPTSMDSYIHRIGRTGRAGKTGKAFTFVD